jgi:hypothetical protein
MTKASKLYRLQVLQYWKNLKTGKICTSTKEVKDITEADSIYYTYPSTQAKVS